MLSNEGEEEEEEQVEDPELLAAQDREIEEFRKRLESMSKLNKPRMPLPANVVLDLSGRTKTDAQKQTP